MLSIVILSILFLSLVMLVLMTYRFRSMEKKYHEISDSDKQHDQIISIQNLVYTSIVLVAVAMLAVIYFAVKDSPWEGHMMEWMNIVVRLMHITFGIAWIGASFYFVFLENALNRTNNVRDELAGNLWAIHGGGFYYLEKYKVAPREIPRSLHWFKYEAYFTWLSGFCLMFIVYYFNAKAFLIDKNVLDISSAMAVSIGIGSFIVAWILYDLLCKSPLVKKNFWFAIIGFAIATGFAYFYAQVFSSRAAYIHFGAMLGTIMAANVFFNIIPSQKAMVNAARQGLPLDPELGKKAGMRSLHNNYLTLPVLFVMISNHFPSTFGNEHAWAVLAAISLGTAGVKHYLNLKEKGQLQVWVLPISIILILGISFYTAPQKITTECKSTISFAEVNTIINTRCVSCHSSKPTDDIWTAPPNGVVYDTPDDIVKLTDKILQRVVITKTMPQNNKTNMTPEERDILRCWIEQGASLK
jgi:uncharacterized membrane protein